MIINRRNFVQSAVCVAATAPTFANLLLLPPLAQQSTLAVAEPTTGQEVIQTTANNPFFKIHGWEASQNIGVDQAQPVQVDRTSEIVNDGRATIRVMQSWRTAWR